MVIEKLDDLALDHLVHARPPFRIKTDRVAIVRVGLADHCIVENLSFRLGISTSWISEPARNSEPEPPPMRATHRSIKMGTRLD